MEFTTDIPRCRQCTFFVLLVFNLGEDEARAWRDVATSPRKRERSATRASEALSSVRARLESLATFATLDLPETSVGARRGKNLPTWRMHL